MAEPQLSPAAERALRAATQPDERLVPVALLLALLEDDEASPATWFATHGLAVDRARAALADVEVSEIGRSELLAAARDISRDRGDYPDLTTDAILLAVLRTDSRLARQLEAAGLALRRLADAIVPPPRDPVTIDFAMPDPTERIVTARILDASANRAREALRVLEDYARFALDDRFLTEELKTLRHSFVEAMEAFPIERLLAGRETLRDVGTTVTTEREGRRTDPAHVALVNVKRLQEALRSLEEFGKLEDAEVSGRLEQLRYRSYTLERLLIRGTSARERLANARLYVLLTGSQCVASLDWTIAEAAAGGAEVFQLREKSLDDRTLLARAQQVRAWTKAAGVLFILNDRPDIARLVGADGVHLGQDDLPINEARRIIGPDALIGVSTHDLGQLRQAILDGADYVGVGPAFATATKPGITIAGLGYVREALAETSLPAFVIGGITPETLGEVIACGANRIAVSAAIARADEPRQMAAILRQSLE